jgi:uncharacterized membrane protein YkvA (DUF1232 family)
MKTSYRSRIHRTHILYPHNTPGKAISLDEYIEAARGEVSTDDVRRFPLLRKEIEVKLQSEQALQHRDLHDGLDVLCRFLSSPRAQEAKDPLPKDIAEAAVAVNYFLKGFDLIPDSIPEIGLTDDVRIVACVLARNPSISS